MKKLLITFLFWVVVMFVIEVYAMALVMLANSFRYGIFISVTLALATYVTIFTSPFEDVVEEIKSFLRRISD